MQMTGLPASVMRGLTQLELAERAGMPPSSVGHFEGGGRLPAFKSLEALAEALEVRVDFLMGRSESSAQDRDEDRIAVAYDGIEGTQRDLLDIQIAAMADSELARRLLRLADDWQARKRSEGLDGA